MEPDGSSFQAAVRYTTHEHRASTRTFYFGKALWERFGPNFGTSVYRYTGMSNVQVYGAARMIAAQFDIVQRACS